MSKELLVRKIMLKYKISRKRAISMYEHYDKYNLLPKLVRVVDDDRYYKNIYEYFLATNRKNSK